MLLRWGGFAAACSPRSLLGKILAFAFADGRSGGYGTKLEEGMVSASAASSLPTSRLDRVNGGLKLKLEIPGWVYYIRLSRYSIDCKDAL